MKKAFLLFLIPFSLLASPLTPGRYECLQGNEESICPQIIKVKGSSISVIYSGDCADQGPFTYFCTSEGVCEDSFVRFTIKNADEYLWENPHYNFYCHFKRIK